MRTAAARSLVVLFLVFSLLGSTFPQPVVAKPPTAPLSAASTPDAFGYTWEKITNAYPSTDPSVGLTRLWPNATETTTVNFAFTGPAFPFYENAYTGITVCTQAGIILPGENRSCPTDYSYDGVYPLGQKTNDANVIATFGKFSNPPTPNYLYGVFAGYEPAQSRYVVLWQDKNDAGFQLVLNHIVYLYLNGNIEIHYQFPSTFANRVSHAIGLEHRSDQFSLIADMQFQVYDDPLPTDAAFRFNRPAAVPRLLLFEDQTQLAAPGAKLDFPINLINAGDVASAPAGNYTLSSNNPACTLLNAGAALSGPVSLAQGDWAKLAARMSVPADAKPGQLTACTIQASVAGQPAKSILLAGPLSFPFSQTLVSYESVQYTYEAQTIQISPAGKTAVTANVVDDPGYMYIPSDLSAVLGLNASEYLQVYTKYTPNPVNPWVNDAEIFVQVFGGDGGTPKPPIKLDASQATDGYHYAGDFALARASTGEVAVAWVDFWEGYDASSNYTEAYQLKLAILNKDGSLKKGPLTVVDLQPAVLPFPYVLKPRLAFDGQDNLALIWNQGTYDYPDLYEFFDGDQIHLRAFSLEGVALTADRTITSDTASYVVHAPVTLLATENGGLLLTFSSFIDDGSGTRVFQNNARGFSPDALTGFTIMYTFTAVDGPFYDTLLLPDSNIMAVGDEGLTVLDGSSFEAIANSEPFLFSSKAYLYGQSFGKQANLALASDQDVLVSFTNGTYDLNYALANLDGQLRFEPATLPFDAYSYIRTSSPYAMATLYVPPARVTPVYLPMIRR